MPASKQFFGKPININLSAAKRMGEKARGREQDIHAELTEE